MKEAATAYRQALASDPKCLLALKGARHLAEVRGDKEEVARLLATEAGLANDVGAMVDSALLAVDMGHGEDAVDRLTSVLESDPANTEVPARLRAMLGEGGAGPIAAIYERIGHAHADAKKGALAWIEAGRIELRELADAPAAFFAAGRALARDPQNLDALELRADAGQAAGRARDAADALQKRLDRGGSDALGAAWKGRLGRLYAEIGDARRALPLLDPALQRVEPELLIKLVAGATALPAPDAVRIYRRLLRRRPNRARRKRSSLAGAKPWAAVCWARDSRRRPCRPSAWRCSTSPATSRRCGTSPSWAARRKAPRRRWGSSK